MTALTDEFLRGIASQYAEAVRSGHAHKPCYHVAQRMPTVSVRTVQRWVYLARQRGIMPKAHPGRADDAEAVRTEAARRLALAAMYLDGKPAEALLDVSTTLRYRHDSSGNLAAAARIILGRRSTGAR